jgi:3-phenylpropionate/cinnamic acid dioxygenase small subunit
VTVDLQLRAEIEQLLYYEARLLDEGRRQEWLELFTDDAIYRMPVRETVQGARRGGSNQVVIDDEMAFDYIYEDKRGLTVRADRLDTGHAHVEQPAAITVRLITNVEVEPLDDGDVLARSNFWVSQMRYERATTAPEDQLGGKRQDIMRREGETWKIARRTVVLAQPLIPKSIAILL